MRTKKLALLVVVVSGLVLAGCTGGQTGTETTTDDGTPDAASVQTDAVAAMEDVETYGVNVSEDQHLEANVERNATVEFTKRVDRPSRELSVDQTARVMGRTSDTDLYVVDETVYQRNDAFARQYNSEWISVDVSENFSRTWTALDSLDRHRSILDASAVELNGTETVDGTEAYVLELETNETELKQLLASRRGATSGGSSGLTIDDAEYTFWIDAETDRPVKVAGTLNMTVESRTATFDLNKTFAFRYQEYGSDVSVTLPDGAKENAVPIGGRLAPALQGHSAADARRVAVR